MKIYVRSTRTSWGIYTDQDIAENLLYYLLSALPSYILKEEEEEENTDRNQQEEAAWFSQYIGSYSYSYIVYTL